MKHLIYCYQKITALLFEQWFGCMHGQEKRRIDHHCFCLKCTIINHVPVLMRTWSGKQEEEHLEDYWLVRRTTGIPPPPTWISTPYQDMNQGLEISSPTRSEESALVDNGGGPNSSIPTLLQTTRKNCFSTRDSIQQIHLSNRTTSSPPPPPTCQLGEN